MINKLSLWGEGYLFTPKGFDYILAFILLPVSLLYTIFMYLRFVSSKAISFDIPIISVGNLIVGGSGKTPVTIALASKYDDVAIVLRGYGRDSKGTIVISHDKQVLENVKVSGDEAMLLAQSLPKATVIVAINRVQGIQKAKSLGAKLIFLDDGYSKHRIKKFDLVLEPKSHKFLPFCLPSGPYREKLWWNKEALILQEDRDFMRKVWVENPSEKMLLVTAISKPWRLDPYLPKVIGKKYFMDHYIFSKEELESLLNKHGATSILTTKKDAVKMYDFGLPLSILALDLDINATISQKIDTYIKEN